MKEIIRAHLSAYPLMEVEDLVKLLYQSEFGGGHLIVDRQLSLERLEREWQETKAWEQEQKAPEAIGEHLCRVYLNGFYKQQLPILNHLFVESARLHTQSRQGFEEKLRLLEQMALQGELPFGPASLQAYLQDYEKRGYPPVSHSDRYRSAYAPAYRVLSAAWASYIPLFQMVDNLLSQKKRPVVIAIDGKSGSGKTTLSKLLQDYYQATVLHLDDYFLRPHQRNEQRLLQPGGNVDYERFAQEVIQPLTQGKKELKVRAYNCQTQTLLAEQQILVEDLVILEGSYSCHPYFGCVQDIRVFLDLDSRLQLERIEKRNGTQMLERFRQEWIPMENLYFQTFDIPKSCQFHL